MKRFLFLTVAALFVLRGLTFIAGCVSPSPSVTFPPYPPYPSYAEYPAYPPYPGQDATTAPRPSGHKVGGTVVPIVTSLYTAAGTSGATVTTPAQLWVSGFTTCAGATNGTVTLGVNGVTTDGSVQDGSVQSGTITVLAGTCLSWPNPPGALYNLGPNSTIVFGGGVATYFVAYAGYGGSP